MPEIDINYWNDFPALTQIAHRPGDYDADDLSAYLAIHQSILDLVLFHVDTAALGAAQLVAMLESRGIKGIRDNCGECPLANLYVATITELFGSYLRDFSVDVTAEEITIRLSLDRSDARLPLGVVVLTLPLSDGMEEFIQDFDRGHIPTLDVEPTYDEEDYYGDGSVDL